MRDGFAATPRPGLEAILAAARETGNSWLQAWADRSAHLMAHPAEFDYALWCAGGLAKRPMN